MAVKRLLLQQGKKAGGAVICQCENHGHAYNDMFGSTYDSGLFNHSDFDDGATILSQAITITEECCVNAVGTILAADAGVSLTDFDLERPKGTVVADQEDETCAIQCLYHYSCWEVLPPGTYTYYLVNRAGATRSPDAAQLKIVAFACTGCVCQFHASAYNEMEGQTPISAGANWDAFDDGATILSQAITITRTCCLLAVGTIFSYSAYDIADFELERPKGTIVVDQEDETPTNTRALFHYAAWEVVPPGTYTYYLVNRAGATRYIFAAQLKIIASQCI